MLYARDKPSPVHHCNNCSPLFLPGRTHNHRWLINRNQRSVIRIPNLCGETTHMATFTGITKVHPAEDMLIKRGG
jgi:hypothetical protein